MVGWHHRLNGQEFEQAPGVDDGQGSLACCSPWGRKELDTTERLNTSIKIIYSPTPAISLPETQHEEILAHVQKIYIQ